MNTFKLGFKGNGGKRNMKNKAMVFIIGCMFLLGMAGNVLAVSDTTGASAQLGPLDLATASVVTYGKPSAIETPDFAKVGITMAAGSHLPGAIIFDFDVDNDTATGGGSIITGIPAGNCGGACKAPAGDGFDFYMVLVLRTQGDTSNLSLASGCQGSSLTCAERGALASCNESPCYELGSPCNIGDPDCYEIEEGGACTGCAGPDAYPLANVCGFSGKDCTQRLIKGEYYIGYGSQNSVMIGDVLIENTYNIFEETDICVTIPWSKIITQMFTRILRDAPAAHPIFDASYPVNNPPKFQVSIFFDDNFDDEDSLFTLPGLNVDVNDWLPDTDRAADGEYNQYTECGYNVVGPYGEQNVGAEDVDGFLSEFGRSSFNQPCPNCKK